MGWVCERRNTPKGQRSDHLPARLSANCRAVGPPKNGEFCYPARRAGLSKSLTLRAGRCLQQCPSKTVVSSRRPWNAIRQMFSQTICKLPVTYLRSNLTDARRTGEQQKGKSRLLLADDPCRRIRHCVQVDRLCGRCRLYSSACRH